MAKEHRFKAEPRDEVWAVGTEADLTRDISGLFVEGGPSVDRIECKSTTCRAEIRYPDYRAATTSMRSLITNSYSLPCATFVHNPRPEGSPESEYVGVMFFDCANEG